MYVKRVTRNVYLMWVVFLYTTLFLIEWLFQTGQVSATFLTVMIFLTMGARWFLSVGRMHDLGNHHILATMWHAFAIMVMLATLYYQIDLFWSNVVFWSGLPLYLYLMGVPGSFATNKFGQSPVRRARLNRERRNYVQSSYVRS
jgi:uncharacterized membrane protein YhaH (DUF805 family)